MLKFQDSTMSYLESISMITPQRSILMPYKQTAIRIQQQQQQEQHWYPNYCKFHKQIYSAAVSWARPPGGPVRPRSKAVRCHVFTVGWSPPGINKRRPVLRAVSQRPAAHSLWRVNFQEISNWLQHNLSDYKVDNWPNDHYWTDITIWKYTRWP